MNHINDRIATLILRHLREGLTVTEQDELGNWLSQSAQHRLLYDQLTDDKQLNEELDRYHYTRTNTWNKLIEAIPELQQGATIVHIGQKDRFRWMAAAAVAILVLSAGTYWLSRRISGKELVQTPANKEYKGDVAPGGNKATLMLADGSAIVLADAQDGRLTPQGHTSLTKQNGELIYQPATTAGQHAGETIYNMLTTPRGGQYRLTLPDGSKVWLNAASSIRYPVAFTGNERRVELTGEGYFEIAKNPLQPFRVNINPVSGNAAGIEVLGTHFNAMAYTDEEALATTLFEGSVKLTKGNEGVVLKEGQQGLVTGRISVVQANNMEAVKAWTKGFFSFKETPLPIIMRQLARWYDVEVVYREQIDEEFTGAVPRNKPISEALKVLSLTGAVHFIIQGKKVIVTK